LWSKTSSFVKLRQRRGQGLAGWCSAVSVWDGESGCGRGKHQRKPRPGPISRFLEFRAHANLSQRRVSVFANRVLECACWDWARIGSVEPNF
jgi:hypothetical protein